MPTAIANLIVKCEAALDRKLRVWALQLYKKSFGYWLIVTIVIVVGMFVGDWLGRMDFWVTKRYQLYGLLQKATTDPPYAKRTVMVFIQDDDFWRGELARRIPVKRDYLAKLVLKLDEGDPQVIALDFRLNSPDPDQTSSDSSAYQSETDSLITALRTVAPRRKIILAKTLTLESGQKGFWSLFQPETDDVSADPAIYDGLDESNIRVGHINLPVDIRQIPLSVTTRNYGQIDSFAAAIVRFVDENAIKNAQAKGRDGLPYGTYMDPEKFGRPLSAGEVLSDDPHVLNSKIAHKIVIVGGSWHRDAFGHGDFVDEHMTPVGQIEGAYIHANYVEALLDTRTHAQMRKGLSVLIEISISIAIAFIFALDMDARKRTLWVTAACLFVAVLTYVAWQNLGLFFDFLIPILLLGSHAAIEQVLEWRQAAGKFRVVEKEAHHATDSV